MLRDGEGGLSWCWVFVGPVCRGAFETEGVLMDGVAPVEVLPWGKKRKERKENDGDQTGRKHRVK